MSISYEPQPPNGGGSPVVGGSTGGGDTTLPSTPITHDWAWLIERLEERNDLEIGFGTWLDEDLVSLESSLSEFAVAESWRSGGRS